MRKPEEFIEKDNGFIGRQTVTFGVDRAGGTQTVIGGTNDYEERGI